MTMDLEAGLRFMALTETLVWLRTQSKMYEDLHQPLAMVYAKLALETRDQIEGERGSAVESSVPDAPDAPGAVEPAGQDMPAILSLDTTDVNDETLQVKIVTDIDCTMQLMFSEVGGEKLYKTSREASLNYGTGNGHRQTMEGLRVGVEYDVDIYASADLALDDVPVGHFRFLKRTVFNPSNLSMVKIGEATDVSADGAVGIDTVTVVNPQATGKG